MDICEINGATKGKEWGNLREGNIINSRKTIEGQKYLKLHQVIYNTKKSNMIFF